MEYKGHDASLSETLNLDRHFRNLSTRNQHKILHVTNYVDLSTYARNDVNRPSDGASIRKGNTKVREPSLH